MNYNKFNSSNCSNLSVRNNGYYIAKSTTIVKYNYNKSTKLKSDILVYNPLININGFYSCKCCKFRKNFCYYHYHYYYSEFYICNKNEFFLYNLIINIGTSSELNYIKGTLKINDKYINDKKTIILDRLCPNESIKISLLCYSPFICNCCNTHIESLKINYCFLGFDNTPKYCDKEDYIIIK